MFAKVSAGARALALDIHGRVWGVDSSFKRMHDNGQALHAVSVAGGSVPLKNTPRGPVAAVWAIGKNGSVWTGTVPLYGTYLALRKIKAPTRFVDIGVGFLGRVVFAVDHRGDIWRRTHITFDLLEGKKWTMLSTPSPMRSIHVSCKGILFAISKTGRLYIRGGLSAWNLSGSFWQVSALKNVQYLATNT